MIVTALTQLPVPPNAHCFFMRLLGFFCYCWEGLGKKEGEVGTSGKTEGLGFGDGRGWHWVRGPSWGVSLVSVRPPPTAARRGGRVSTKGVHEELHFPLCPRGWPRQ